jgi:hypothetical protein
MMINIQKLRGKGFPEENVPPYGLCIKVPEDKFDWDWESALADQGHGIVHTEIQGEKFTLIRLTSDNEDGLSTRSTVSTQSTKSAEASDKSLAEFPWSDEEEKRLIRRMDELKGTVYERATLLISEFSGRSAVALRQKFYQLTGLKGVSKRKARPRPERMQTPWTPQEDDLLIDLWNKRLTRHAIAVKVEGRSEEAVQNRLKRLQDDGRIKPRWKQKRKRQHREKVESKGPTLGSEPTKERESTPMHTPISGEVPIEQKILDVLKEIRDAFVPETFSFDYHCRNCGENGTVSNFKRIYEFCPVCGKPLIVWNVEVS